MRRVKLSSGNEKLSSLDNPEDLKKLSLGEKRDLACLIRKELIDVISENGGHLAPNLGVVELTIALHSVFDMPEDKILWDVGHQGYVHKILTGRRDYFKTLRKDGGCSGFLSREESAYDVFGAGHAGTAISSALGFAAARDLDGGTEKVIAVVGDGALNCGISLEGLNNVVETTDDFIIILNDNKMSISRNVGAMAGYLNRIISMRRYNKLKSVMRKVIRSIPLIGNDITKKISKLEEAAKSMFVPGVIFEELGIRYLGPVNGHDIGELIRTFEVIKEFPRPVIVHVLTEKGRGYQHAEAAPEKFHGLSCFNPESGSSLKQDAGISYSEAFGSALCKLAGDYDDVVGITAAMCSGTCMTEFAKNFTTRFYDVGIAEEHALVFAAGLAAAGKRVVVPLYASFLQRALDYVMHDICLQNLPVIICADRAGVVDDGPTHHGIHDLAFILNLPNMTIMSPCDAVELEKMLFAAYDYKSPVLIRYPRGEIFDLPESDVKNGQLIIKGRSVVLKRGCDLMIWAVGGEVNTAFETSEILSERYGIDAGVVNARFLKPFDADLLIGQASESAICTIENYQIKGGLGGLVDSTLINKPHRRILHFGWNDSVIPHGTVSGIREKLNFTSAKIAKKIASLLDGVVSNS